ncbi:dihydroxyacetone kinase subunit DhaK [Boseongicola sp. H5]|uniref:dihydroxyacetone kinase subunit DhaK n=1 Tax=Boseongicola sp. H5 TaxID=2763261 RepID=UPI001B25A0FC|nr:dihydroxyacetone kinase subunit DhaK [Boseongicola sp. H5]MBO6921974.1 dihydroxyacetone kinase subunit DhaK [Roseicyclus sp.]
MTKIMNMASDYVDESLDGLCLAHPSLRVVGEERRVVARTRPKDRDKVGIASGGGYGHLPLFCGYVGAGLLDACAVGNVFEGPTVGASLDSIQTADGGAGVLCLFGNYGGDRMNFEMAASVAADDGITTRTVLGTDDIASANEGEASNRRGVAGLLFAYKCAGAAAEAGADLETVARIAQKTVDRTRTIGFALAPCLLPGRTAPAFAVVPGSVQFGMGIHGEPGLWQRPFVSADDIAVEMIDRLLDESVSGLSSRVAILVNSLGASPFEELFILYRSARRLLENNGFATCATKVGPYVTSMEMAGASISLCFVDDELEKLLAAPANCPFWRTS